MVMCSRIFRTGNIEAASSEPPLTLALSGCNSAVMLVCKLLYTGYVTGYQRKNPARM